MRAQKITVKVTVEVLDVASVPALMREMLDQLEKTTESGTLAMPDGDVINWVTTNKSVTI